MHIAFFDTRPRPDTGAMLAAAQQIRKAGGADALRFHVLLNPKLELEVPGMSRTPLRLPPAAQCLFSGLARLAHGPGPAYLYKPLLHWLLPSVRRLILLDTDTVTLIPSLRDPDRNPDRNPNRDPNLHANLSPDPNPSS